MSLNCARCGELHPICAHHQSKDNPRIDLLLEEAEQLGTSVSAVCDYRGMASIKLLWQPYECVWIASCSWSDSSEIKTHSRNVVEALDALVDTLSVEYNKVHKIWIKDN